MKRLLSDNILLQRFGNTLQDVAFTPYAMGYVGIKELESRYLVSKFAEENRLSTISDLDFKELKSSDTLYILGTGSSINRYSTHEWDTISSGDSVGVNYWAIHEFVPDFYVFELPRDAARRDAMYQLFQTKSEFYQDTTFIVKDVPTLSSELNLDRLPPSIKANLYASREVPIPWDEQDPATLRYGCRLMAKAGYFSQENIRRVPYKSASIIYLISLGINMGYKNIVLCGVDLSNPEHFYTEKSEYYLDRGIPLPRESVTRNVHKTISSEEKSITVDNVIKQLASSVVPDDTTLYVGSKESALHPMLDYYFQD